MRILLVVSLLPALLFAQAPEAERYGQPAEQPLQMSVKMSQIHTLQDTKTLSAGEISDLAGWSWAGESATVEALGSYDSWADESATVNALGSFDSWADESVTIEHLGSYDSWAD